MLGHLDDERAPKAGEERPEPSRDDEFRRDVQAQRCIRRQEGGRGNRSANRGRLELEPEPGPGGDSEDEAGAPLVGEPGQSLVADDVPGTELDDRLEVRLETTLLKDRPDARPGRVVAVARLEPRGHQRPDDRAERREGGQALDQPLSIGRAAGPDADRPEDATSPLERRVGEGVEPGRADPLPVPAVLGTLQPRLRPGSADRALAQLTCARLGNQLTRPGGLCDLALGGEDPGVACRELDGP